MSDALQALLERSSDDGVQTLGNLELIQSNGESLLRCDTLERPWKHNQRRISCIPKGVYQVVPRQSRKLGRHYLVKDVEGRDLICIHSANFYQQLEGCIAVGQRAADANRDGEPDLARSRATLDRLLSLAPQGFELIVN